MEAVSSREMLRLMLQTRFGFGQRDHPPPDGGHMLAQGEIEPFDKRGIDLPAVLGQ